MCARTYDTLIGVFDSSVYFNECLSTAHVFLKWGEILGLFAPEAVSINILSFIFYSGRIFAEF